MIGAPAGGVDSSDRRGCTFSCDLLLSSTSPNNNTHPLLNIEKNEARFACLPLVHLQGIEEHHRGVEFTLCHSYSPGRLCRALALPKDLLRNGRSTSLNCMLQHFHIGKTPGIGTVGRRYDSEYLLCCAQNLTMLLLLKCLGRYFLKVVQKLIELA